MFSGSRPVIPADRPPRMPTPPARRQGKRSKLPGLPYRKSEHRSGAVFPARSQKDKQRRSLLSRKQNLSRSQRHSKESKSIKRCRLRSKKRQQTLKHDLRIFSKDRKARLPGQNNAPPRRGSRRGKPPTHSENRSGNSGQSPETSQPENCSASTSGLLPLIRTRFVPKIRLQKIHQPIHPSRSAPGAPFR